MQPKLLKYMLNKLSKILGLLWRKIHNPDSKSMPINACRLCQVSSNLYQSVLVLISTHDICDDAYLAHNIRLMGICISTNLPWLTSVKPWSQTSTQLIYCITECD